MLAIHVVFEVEHAEGNPCTGGISLQVQEPSSFCVRKKKFDAALDGIAVAGSLCRRGP